MMVPKRLPVIVALILTFALLMSGCNHVEAAKPAPTPSSSNQSSVLTEINGTVEVLQAGSTNWTQAMDGMRLKAGDRIRTGGNSSVLLLFFEGSTMELQPDTEVSIEELNRAPDTGSTAIGLKQTIGNTLNRVEKLVDSQSRYEVETPSASAVVRGTGYWVQVLPDGTTTIRVSSGSVWIMAQSVVVVVNAGEESTIRPGSPPGTPVPISTPAPSPTSAASPSSQPTPTPNITPSPYVTLEASPTPAAPPPIYITSPTPTASPTGGAAELPILKAGFQAWPTGGKPPLTVRFFDFSEGEIVSRVWDFGDGSLSTDKDPYHTYSAVGNGTVSLTVYDGTRSDTETKPGYIIVYPPSGSPNTTEVTGDIPPPWWQE